MTGEYGDMKLRELFRDARRQDAGLAPRFEDMVRLARRMEHSHSFRIPVIAAAAGVAAFMLIAAFLIPMLEAAKSRGIERLAAICADMSEWQAPTDALLQLPTTQYDCGIPYTGLGGGLPQWPDGILTKLPDLPGQLRLKQGGG